MKKFYIFLVLVVLITGAVITYRQHIEKAYYMTRGDAASQCAAIYSIMEPSLLGQTLELLIMWTRLMNLKTK
jgi:hypothetical protein